MSITNKSPTSRVMRISAAEFIIASAILLILEIFLFYHFLIGPKMAAAAAVRAELGERRAALDVFYANKAATDERRGLINDLTEQINIAETKLPPALHNEDIAAMIGTYSREHNIAIESISFSERQLVDPSVYYSSTGDEANANASAYTNAGANANAYTNANTNANTDDDSLAFNAALQSALYEESDVFASRTLSLQGVQIQFNSEFHTAGQFIKAFEDSQRKVHIKGVSLARVQEGELKGVLNLEFASLSASAEQNLAALSGETYDIGAKESIFSKYNGFIEDNADPTILLLSEDDDIDPDFYIVLKASSSNETKMSYGVYPRVETELRSNVNNASRAKLTISGDEEQFDYVYSLASYQKSEKRKLAAVGGVIRIKVISCQRLGDDDNVAVLLDIDNNTELPVEIVVVNDDVLSPRFHLGLTKGNVNAVTK